MQFISKLDFKQQKKIFYFIFLLIFSILFNQYYGYIGILPLDSFLIFNSGYDFLNGYFPFKDYWTITGPLLDVVQAFFFKVFGVSWFSYVLHASVFNFIITISTFFTLSKFKLNLNFCFFYSILVSILCYPIAGTPFMDHHSSILSIIGLFVFVLALKTNLNFYWLVLPIILGMAFLSKQTPAAYVSMIVGTLTIVYFSINLNIRKILMLIFGTFLFFFTLFSLLFVGEISIISFFEQYILFPQSIGKHRLELLFPLEFKRIILRFKLIHISMLVLIFIVVKKTIEDYKYVKKDEFLIIISLISCGWVFVIHQLMTINAKFIFFIIPILTGFSHIYFEKYFNKKYILFFLIFLCFSSTIYYHYTYNSTRKFMDLDKVNLNNAVDAKILDKKLNKLKWISILYPENPKKEISQLVEAIEIIKNDKRKKVIVTDYQFISVFMSTYDYSPNKFWHAGVGYPKKNEIYFDTYKKFFTDKLLENKIEVVYTVKPLYYDKDVLSPILKESCLTKIKHTDILISQLITECDLLKN